MAKIVVGVTGGIAAYKSAPLIRLFSEAGHSVKVVATKNALRFIGQTTLEALSKNSVDVIDPDLFTDVETVKHVAIGQEADLLVVAPATASFIAKVAAGIADDLLTTTILATSAPVVIAPAMHTEMWENRATVANISTLRSRGIQIVEPEIGRLTGEDSGAGRLADPSRIFEEAQNCLSPQYLKGLRVLVATGGTREPIDSARFIGNYSSGKQGLAFAHEALAAGAEVKVIAANLTSEQIQSLDAVPVQTAAQLLEALEESFEDFDIFIMAAAVADFRPVETRKEKIKRSGVGDRYDLPLIANPDILKTLCSKRKAKPKVIVGFAAETEADLAKAARDKLVAKGCDYVVANNISSGEVFGSDSNSTILVSAADQEQIIGSKREIASRVLSLVSSRLGAL